MSEDKETGLVDKLPSSLVPLGMILYGLLFDIVSPIIIMSITGIVTLFSALYLLRKRMIVIVHPKCRHKEKYGLMQQIVNDRIFLIKMISRLLLC